MISAPRVPTKSLVPFKQTLTAAGITDSMAAIFKSS
jgi:hypothetical protein